MPLSISSAARQLSDGNSVGTVLGQATNNAGLPDNLALFGATPAPQLLQGTLKGVYGMLNCNTVANSPSSVLANSSSEKSFTVIGVAATDMVVTALKDSAQAGLLVGTARVSATNTILLTMGNNTAANVTPTTTESYQFITVPATMAFSQAISPVSVAASTSVEQQFTVTGVQAGMAMSVNKPTLNAGLVISQCRAIGLNTVGITFTNCTAAAVTPTTNETYLFFGAQCMRAVGLMEVYSQAITPVSVAANTTAEQTFTVPGLAYGGTTITALTSQVVVNKPTLQAGLGIAGARVSAQNQIGITFANATATAITPTAAEVYTVMVFNTPPVAAGANEAIGAVMQEDAGHALGRMGL
jgi:hypothetical protein